MDLGYSVVLFSILLCSVLVILLGKNPDLLKFRKNRQPGTQNGLPADDREKPSEDSQESQAGIN